MYDCDIEQLFVLLNEIISLLKDIKNANHQKDKNS